MKKIKHSKNELQPFLVLWSTQSLSRLGSAMTSFALTLWLYEQTGSALQTAFLSICSYTPYGTKKGRCLPAIRVPQAAHWRFWFC